MHDLIIRNADVADGLGNPLRRADVAVGDGRITRIGEVTGPAAEEVDASGLVLAPGVIDVHTHYDAQLTWDPTASPSPGLGVTTVVIGNCGFGIAPASADVRGTIARNLAVVEAMSIDCLEAGIDWGFESFAEYLALLRRKGVYPNVAAYASHSAIRSCVMKDAGSERAATPEELAAMVALFRQCMQAGAFGLGSSTFENHNGWNGIPVPSRLAGPEEFRAFAGVIADAGFGSMMATCGNATSIAFLEELAEISGRPVIYAPLLHYSNQPRRAFDIAAACAAARARGCPVYAQGSCQPLSMDFTLTAAYPMLTIEGWPKAQAKDAVAAVLSDPAFRRGMREDLKSAKGTRIFNGHWDRVEVTTSGNAALQGRSIAEIAAEMGKDPVDAFLDLGLADNLDTVFTAKLLNVEEDAVAALLRDEGVLVSLSDAGAHHTFFCDAGFGMHFLGHWVRERRLFTLPEAIRKLTSDLADIYGIPDRGRLVEGAFADMIPFDPASIAITRPERIVDLPANSARLIRRAPGLKATFVNGVRVFDGTDYVVTKPPGQVLTRFTGAAPTVGMPPAR